MLVGTITARLPRLHIPWGYWLLAFILVIPNAVVLFSSLQFIRERDYVYDWWLLEEAANRIGTGTMYEWGAPGELGDVYLFRYSPILPILMQPLLAFGLEVWRLLHVTTLLLLPGPIALLVLISGPFWADVASGNFVTFAVVAAWFALGGHRLAIGAYFALTFLIPRPLMIPVGVWLLWKRPESRGIGLAVVVVGVAASAATGELLAWTTALLLSGDIIGGPFDFGPSRLIGAYWIPLGILLAAIFTWKERLGLASLAISPYLLPYYFLMALLELFPRHRLSRSTADAAPALHASAPAPPSQTQASNYR